MVKLLRMGSVSSVVAMAAVCIGVLFLMPLVAKGFTCPVTTYYEPCIPAALNGNAKPCPECCAIVRNAAPCNCAACMCAQAQAQTFGAPF
jgi:hypothetical protein